MPRVKRGTIAHKRRKKILKLTKGFRYSRNTKFRLAKDALRHALTYAFRDRKAKKRNFRKLWNIQINAFVRQLGLSYSQFINKLKTKNIQLDRKILSELAKKHPHILTKIVEETKNRSNNKSL